MSQRTGGFKGGIQEGTTAWDDSSLKLDNQVSSVSKLISESIQTKKINLKFQKKLKKDQIPGNIGACAPDGGVWFSKSGKLIAAFEAKKQGLKGNAIERWWNNHAILRAINPNISYVTFCSGEGATIDGPIGQCLALAVWENGKHHFNTLRPRKNSVFLSPNGYTEDEIYSIMTEILFGKT